MSEPLLRLERWSGPVDPGDPDARFKEQVAELSQLDPTQTLDGMSRALGIPPGAIARYVLARWASEGSAGLMEIGPSMVQRLWAPIAQAEAQGDDAARLAAYAQVRGLLSWLHAPLDDAPPQP
jgi:hypothetical protein